MWSHCCSKNDISDTDCPLRNMPHVRQELSKQTGIVSTDSSFTHQLVLYAKEDLFGMLR